MSEKQSDGIKNEKENRNGLKAFFGKRVVRVISFIIIVIAILLIAFFGTNLKHYIPLKLTGKTQVFDAENNKYVIKKNDDKIHIDFEDGTKYDGEFADGKFEGEGKIVYANGDIYEGEFEDGLKEGNGTYIWKIDNNKYEGEWVEDKMTGEGTYYFSKTEYLSGVFSDNDPLTDLKYTKSGKTINVEYDGEGTFYEEE